MGAVTGKGLSDLIREEFGFRVTFFLMLALVVTNFGNVMAEFAGVASSLELFGISRYIVVPLAAAIVWVLVVQGTYNSVEKIFLSRRPSTSATSSPGCWPSPTGRRPRSRTVTRPRGRRHPQLRLRLHADRPGRHDHRAVDAVLPAGVGRREGRDGAAVPGVAVGRDRRLPLRRDRRLVHHRRLRGDAAHAGRHRDPRRGRRGAGAAAAGRRVRVPALRRRAVQRLALRRDRSCRSRRRTRSAKGWDSSRGSTRSSTRRRRSTGCTRC